MPPLTYEVQVGDDGLVVVALHGELCMSTVPGLRAVVDNVPFRWLVLDLAGLSFVDSSGIGFLVHLHRECEVGLLRLSLSNVTDQTRRVLDVAGVLPLFDLEGVR